MPLGNPPKPSKHRFFAACAAGPRFLADECVCGPLLNRNPGLEAQGRPTIVLSCAFVAPIRPRILRTGGVADQSPGESRGMNFSFFGGDLRSPQSRPSRDRGSFVSVGVDPDAYCFPAIAPDAQEQGGGAALRPAPRTRSLSRRVGSNKLSAAISSDTSRIHHESFSCKLRHLISGGSTDVPAVGLGNDATMPRRSACARPGGFKAGSAPAPPDGGCPGD